MSDEIKYMDVEEFRELGYLQEANRLFFHPVGLALEWDAGWTRATLGKFLEDRGWSLLGAEALDDVWTFVRAAGLDKARISGVWDYRDDPEGIMYGRPTENGIVDNPISAEKAACVQAEYERHVEAREALFGSVVQDVPGE